MKVWGDRRSRPCNQVWLKYYLACASSFYPAGFYLVPVIQKLVYSFGFAARVGREHPGAG